VPKKSIRQKNFKNKDCLVRKTDQILHKLGKIKEKDTIVEFGMWTGYEGKSGKFLLLKENITFIEIKLNEDLIIINSTLVNFKFKYSIWGAIPPNHFIVAELKFALKFFNNLSAAARFLRIYFSFKIRWNSICVRVKYA